MHPVATMPCLRLPPAAPDAPQQVQEPPEEDSSFTLSFAACEKAALAAVRLDNEKSEALAKVWGYRLGSMLYDDYLAGRVTPGGLRRLFLSHLNEPGVARKVCRALIARVRSASRKSRTSRAHNSGAMLI